MQVQPVKVTATLQQVNKLLNYKFSIVLRLVLGINIVRTWIQDEQLKPVTDLAQVLMACMLYFLLRLYLQAE